MKKNYVNVRVWYKYQLTKRKTGFVLMTKELFNFYVNNDGFSPYYKLKIKK